MRGLGVEGTVCIRIESATVLLLLIRSASPLGSVIAQHRSADVPVRYGTSAERLVGLGLRLQQGLPRLQQFNPLWRMCEDGGCAYVRIRLSVFFSAKYFLRLP